MIIKKSALILMIKRTKKKEKTLLIMHKC